MNSTGLYASALEAFSEIELRARFHVRVILIFVLLSQTFSLVYPQSWSALFSENQPASPEGFQNVILADTVAHGSIDISSDQDFILQGWPGNGTQSNPFIIENLSIFESVTCINITDTDAFFLIKDCDLEAEVNELMPYQICVYFKNVTNGGIVNSTLSSRADAIKIIDSDFCHVDRCYITARLSGLRIINCTYFALSNSLLSSHNIFDLFITNSDHLLVLSNHLIGGDSGDGGLDVVETSEFEIRNNTLQNHDDEGMIISFSSYGLIVNNSVSENYLGIELWIAENIDVINNSVYSNHIGFNLRSEVENCTFERNSIHHNDYGLMTLSVNCNYSKNTFSANRYSNAEDNGEGNSWFQNWWDDYVGYGWYSISGSAGSFDIDPSPKNNVLLFGTVTTIFAVLLCCFILVTVGARRLRRRVPIDRSSVDWDLKERLTIPLLITMLLPTGIFLYFPAHSLSRWLILVATPLGIISWTAYPSWGHYLLEFIFPFAGDFQTSIYYSLFGLLWFLLSAFVVRSFWLFAGGEIGHARMKRTIHSVLLVMILLCFFTLTIPLPLLLAVALLQVSRFSDVE
jgi:parallel beta-helix repeat protein